jgi:cytochrome c
MKTVADVMKDASFLCRYSDAVKGSGIVWSDKHLDQWLINPKKYIPGSKMVFAGLKKPQERADIIAHMATFSP